MTSWTLVRAFACVVVTFFLLRTIALLAFLVATRSRSSRSHALRSHVSTPLRTLVILGSGGHTAEMMSIMDGLDRTVYTPLVFVRAATDATSAVRVQRKEETKDNGGCVQLQIPRSREVSCGKQAGGE
jgi:beta-1,4-N-acetylglucosaminyltransferase